MQMTGTLRGNCGGVWSMAPGGHLPVLWRVPSEPAVWWEEPLSIYGHYVNQINSVESVSTGNATRDYIIHSYVFVLFTLVCVSMRPCMCAVWVHVCFIISNNRTDQQQMSCAPCQYAKEVHFILILEVKGEEIGSQYDVTSWQHDITVLIIHQFNV